MTPLREQLRSARDGYETARYPGDLAAELLPRRMSWPGSLFIGTLSAGAVAAAAVLASFVGRPMFVPASSHPRPLMPMVRQMPLPPRMDFSLPSLPSLPVPNFSLRPSLPSIGLPDGLHVPSLQDLHLPKFPDSLEHA